MGPEQCRPQWHCPRWLSIRYVIRVIKQTHPVEEADKWGLGVCDIPYIGVR